MSSSAGESSPAYPSIGAFSTLRWTTMSGSPPADGSDTTRGTPSHSPLAATRQWQSPSTPSSQRTVRALPTVPESPSSQGVFQSPQPYGSSYIQAPIGPQLNRSRQSTSNTRYTALGVPYAYASTVRNPQAVDAPSTSTLRANAPANTSQPRLSTDSSREQAARRQREQMQSIVSDAIQEHTRSMDERMGRLEAMIQNLTVHFNSIDNVSIAGSARSDRSRHSARTSISARIEQKPAPWYTSREDSTDRIPQPNVEGEMTPGSVQDGTGTPSRVIEQYLADRNRQLGFPTISEETDAEAAGVYPGTEGAQQGADDDGPIIVEIVNDERSRTAAAPDDKGGSSGSSSSKSSARSSRSFTPVTPVNHAPEERALRAQRRREPLMTLNISRPGDGRRMSLPGTGDHPSRAPQTPPIAATRTSRIPINSSGVLVSTPTGQNSGMYNIRPNNRLARGSALSPAAANSTTQAAPATVPVRQVANVSHQLQPRATGYPIGTVPTDSISRMVINTLQAHENDGDSQRNLGKRGLKLDPPPTYNGTPKLRDFEEWVSGVLRYFRMSGLCGPTVIDNNNRVYIIGHLCAGKAQSWFHKTVEKSEYGPEGWTTLEVIQGLQRRFLTTRSATIAAHEFRTLKQGTMDAQELYEELRLLADQQPIPPDPLTFALRYMNALHAPIRHLVNRNGFHAVHDFANITELVRSAVDTGLALIMAKEEKDPDQMVMATTNSQRTDHKGKSRQKGERREKNKTSSSTREVDSRAKPGISSSSKDRSSGQSKEESELTCYRCGKKGHIAPNCPAKSTVSAKAVEPIIEPEGEESSIEDAVNVAMAYASSSESEEELTSEEDNPRHPLAEYSGSDDEDSIWNQFNAEYGTLSARAVRIVPLEDEVDARAASTSKKQLVEPEPVSTPVVQKRGAPSKGAQPNRIEENQKPITGYFKVGTTLAYVLFDSGSCIDMISPTFVRVANIMPIALEKPIGLQLTLKGSRGKCNFGVNTDLEIGPVKGTHYFDVVNIEKYDIIIGTPFMRQFGVSIDFSLDALNIKGTRVPNGFQAEVAETSADRRVRFAK
ncbi:hypothetical protein FS749_000528 [Ceratobasidium sp. UAMH 11750]|nr:hypothetical protein FS749_000528 [Ceratobasidium sp. UAMH 11750]